MAPVKWTWWEHDPVKQIAGRRKYRANLFRYRWLYTLMDVGLIVLYGYILLQERAHWTLLRHVRAWMHPYDSTSPAVYVFVLAVTLISLCRMWMLIVQYRQEQAALEQHRQMQDAARAPGVWPPPPYNPEVL